MMIPGLLCDKGLFQPIINSFKKNYEINIADVSRASSIDECAKSIAKNINNDVILIGFSYGAWVSLHLYSQIKQYCRGIVLISSAPGNLTNATKQRFEQYVQEIISGDFAKFVEDDFEHDVSEINQSNSELKKNFMAMVYRQGEDVAIRQLKSMIAYQGLPLNFTEINCPTLLMRGAEDKSINIPKQEKMLHEIPQAELAIISDSAHYIPIENPESTASTIESWIRKRGPKSPLISYHP